MQATRACLAGYAVGYSPSMQSATDTRPTASDGRTAPPALAIRNLSFRYGSDLSGSFVRRFPT